MCIRDRYMGNQQRFFPQAFIAFEVGSIMLKHILLGLLLLSALSVSAYAQDDSDNEDAHAFEDDGEIDPDSEYSLDWDNEEYVDDGEWGPEEWDDDEAGETTEEWDDMDDSEYEQPWGYDEDEDDEYGDDWEEEDYDDTAYVDDSDEPEVIDASEWYTEGKAPDLSHFDSPYGEEEGEEEEEEWDDEEEEEEEGLDENDDGINDSDFHRVKLKYMLDEEDVDAYAEYFHRSDHNDDGYLDLDELIFIDEFENYDDETIERWMEKSDADHDEYLDFEEFVDLLFIRDDDLLKHPEDYDESADNDWESAGEEEYYDDYDNVEYDANPDLEDAYYVDEDEFQRTRSEQTRIPTTTSQKLLTQTTTTQRDIGFIFVQFVLVESVCRFQSLDFITSTLHHYLFVFFRDLYNLRIALSK
eukprot:TRINITY_DN942_c0_g2_i1.p1 TRINITY_DN942_c0_g2~~TRINITY_DN942_c0_g2_i1.p1  ORF type:complete len:413 (+),score=129.43 TRINITY_DN942_c0_g2_i1:65-1303(+)